ncbi:MAG TPA: extracellular solute-binding protein, partial [Candidatus Nanopelagicales bacterium]
AQAFATNTMAIAVPPGNPAGIRTFADLARPGLAVVVCAPQVPCGAATTRVAAASGVTLAPVSEEGSVTDVLGKVTAGEADAGVVYATDVAGAGGAVAAVAIPSAVNTTNTYPIAVLAGSRDPGLAGQFRALVLGPEGREVLADAGFGAP